MLDDAFHINYIQPQRDLIYYAMEGILAKTFWKDCSTSDYDTNSQILNLGYITSSLYFPGKVNYILGSSVTL